MKIVSPGETRSSLILRLKDCEDWAWHEFVRLYAPTVFRYAIRCGLQASDAEDITQEVLIEVSRSVKNFEYQPQKGRFRDWLQAITRRRLARYWRSQSPCDMLIAEPVDDSVVVGVFEEELHRTILVTALDNIQHRFAEVTWQAFQAVWRNDEPPVSTAQRLGISIEMVYNAKSRVLRQLESEVLRLIDEST